MNSNKRFILFTSIVIFVVLSIIQAFYNSEVSYTSSFVFISFFSIVGGFLVFNYSKQVKSKEFFIYFIFFTIINVLLFHPVTQQGGWPFNHEWLSGSTRVIMYVHHFTQFDYLPVFSVGDAGNMGSLLPLFYHKFFNYLCSGIYMVIGSMKTSILLSLFILNSLGSYGVYKCSRLLGNNKISSFSIGIILMFLHYSITDWFIRGAFAEYASLMVLPWLFYWCIKFIKTKEFSYKIIPILFFLFLAHNLTTLFSIIMLIMSLIFVVYKSNKSELKKVFTKGSISVFVFLFLILPQLILMKKVGDYYDPEKIKFEIHHFFHDWQNYIIDTSYTWGKTWEGYTVEIGLLFWAALLIGLFISFTKFKSFEHKKVFIWLICVLIFYFVMQLRSSLFLYDIIPGADYIQFPWRLIVFIQISGLLLISLTPLKSKSFVLGTFAFCMVFSYPLFRNLDKNYSWFSKSQLETKVNYGVYGVGEYVPNVLPKENNTFQYFVDLKNQGFILNNNPINIDEEIKNSEHESLVNEYRLDSEGGELKLPFNYSSLEEVFVYQNDTRIELETYRTDSDPRIHVKIPNGKITLVVYLPSYFTWFN